MRERPMLMVDRYCRGDWRSGESRERSRRTKEGLEIGVFWVLWVWWLCENDRWCRGDWGSEERAERDQEELRKVWTLESSEFGSLVAA